MDAIQQVNRVRAALGKTLLLPLVADGEYHEWQHPRDKHGRWIEKLDSIHFGDGLAGIVEGAKPDGTVVAKVTHSPNKEDIGKRVSVDPSTVESIEAKARLDADVVGPGLGEPDTDVEAEKEPDFTPPARQFRPMTSAERLKHKVMPGWSNVQFNESWSNGDSSIPDDKYDGLIATGIDKQGNRQYLYDVRAKKIAADKKFGPDGSVGKTLDNLPGISKVIKRDMVSNDSAGALSLQLLLGMRVGGSTSKNKKVNEEAFGASNLQARHVSIDDTGTNFSFRGKKGVQIRLRTEDPLIREMMSEKLKTRSGEDKLFDTNDRKVRAYFGEVQKELGISGLHTHNLRHAFATSMAQSIVNSYPQPRTRTEFAKQRLEVAAKVSQALGNTPSEALKSYIDPKVWDAWRGENLDWK